MLATREASGFSVKSAAVKSASTIEVVAIDEDSAVRDVSVVIENHIVVVPVVSPVSPPPTKSTKESDSETKAERDSRTGEVQPWIRVPTWPDPDWVSINEPRIVFRHVNDFRIRRLDHNGFPLLAYFFLGRAF